MCFYLLLLLMYFLSLHVCLIASFSLSYCDKVCFENFSYCLSLSLSLSLYLSLSSDTHIFVLLIAFKGHLFLKEMEFFKHGHMFLLRFIYFKMFSKQLQIYSSTPKRKHRRRISMNFGCKHSTNSIYIHPSTYFYNFTSRGSVINCDG